MRGVQAVRKAEPWHGRALPGHAGGKGSHGAAGPWDKLAGQCELRAKLRLPGRVRTPEKGNLCPPVFRRVSGNAIFAAQICVFCAQTFPHMNSDRIRRLVAKGGLRMESERYWRLFCMTGAPEAYMLYRTAGSQEET